jgi:hypothetical protein
MELETTIIQKKVAEYIKQVGIAKGKRGKIEILDSLFTYLSGPGALLLEKKKFNKAVKKKLYNFYFNDCISECISWWRMIYNEDIHLRRVSPMPRHR